MKVTFAISRSRSRGLGRKTVQVTVVFGYVGVLLGGQNIPTVKTGTHEVVRINGD